VSDSVTSANTVVRAALLKIDPETTLAAVDTLDLRAHSKVSAVIGVPLRQLQQRRDVAAFAASAPVAAVKATLELLAGAPLERVIEQLGDHAESPTYEQLSAAIDELIAAGMGIDDAVAVLAYAVGESFPAAAHCRRLFEERPEFTLPSLPTVATPGVLVSPREVSPEIREQRRARRDEQRRRKKPSAPTRPPRPVRQKGVTPSHPSANASPPGPVVTTPVERRPLNLTPLEHSRFDVVHALVGQVLLVDVPFDAQDPLQPDVTSKERPALVVAASNDELLVRPIYSNQSPSRSVFVAWRRIGLDHVSFIDDVRLAVPVANADLHQPLGLLTTSEWNLLA
jgi:hypothetical protein